MKIPAAVRRPAKRLLQSVGLHDVAARIYMDLTLATPSIVRRELVHRLWGSPDGQPIPSPGLIYLVNGTSWCAIHLDSGALVMDDMRKVLASQGLSFESLPRVLDFGCGCGRLIRHLGSIPGMRLSGTDYNPRLAGWCASHLRFGSFETNDLAPPLRYAGESFDYVYARSIFTHLPEELQVRWMRELHRILAEGGILYITTAGAQHLGKLSDPGRERYHQAEVVVLAADRAGENACATVQSRAHFEKRLLDGFELVAFVEGRPQSPHLSQDIYLLRKVSPARS